MGQSLTTKKLQELFLVELNKNNQIKKYLIKEFCFEIQFISTHGFGFV